METGEEIKNEEKFVTGQFANMTLYRACKWANL
jgi:hypothetical protein